MFHCNQLFKRFKFSNKKKKKKKKSRLQSCIMSSTSSNNKYKKDMECRDNDTRYNWCTLNNPKGLVKRLDDME